MTSKVAVLLAAYNGREWLDEQVLSILMQKHVEVTLYISVDKSTDGTELWVDELIAKNSNVVALPYGMKFGGAGRNFFRLIHDVDLSGYDYVSFADQDDIWDELKLSAAVAELVGRGVDAYAGNVLAFWPNGVTKRVVKSQPQVKYDYFFEAGGPGCTCVFTKKLATHLKEFVVENWEGIQSITLHDWFFYAFARSKGYEWFIDPRCFMRYRQHANNQVGVNTGFKAFRTRTAQLFNGSWLRQVELMASMLDAKDSAFVKSWRNFGFLGSLNLAARGFQCRRRTRDKVLFVFFLVALSLCSNK